MSELRQLQSGSEAIIWWASVQRTIEEYQNLLNKIPTLNTEKPHVMADRIKMLYVDVQNSQHPDEASEIYTHITRSMINLSMSYEAIRQLKMDDSDIYHERAMQDWFNASRAFAQSGIVLEI